MDDRRCGSVRKGENIVAYAPPFFLNSKKLEVYKESKMATSINSNSSNSIPFINRISLYRYAPCIMAAALP